MEQKQILMIGGTVILTPLIFLMVKSLKATNKKQPETEAKEPAKADDAEEVKRQIMREMARKGGKKSVEVRRAKKEAKLKAEENEPAVST